MSCWSDKHQTFGVAPAWFHGQDWHSDYWRLLVPWTYSVMGARINHSQTWGPKNACFLPKHDDQKGAQKWRDPQRTSAWSQVSLHNVQAFLQRGHIFDRHMQVGDQPISQKQPGCLWSNPQLSQIYVQISYIHHGHHGFWRVFSIRGRDYRGECWAAFGQCGWMEVFMRVLNGGWSWAFWHLNFHGRARNTRPGKLLQTPMERSTIF